jgi:hypothetical protein
MIDMIWTVPWALLGLVPIAAVAAVSLLRPQRKRLVVASVSLWQRVLQTHAASGARQRRRPSATWWCLFLGAIAAVLAASAPGIERSPARRQLTIRLYPSAEVAPQTFIDASEAILDKLDSSDRVRLILPSPIDGRGEEWLSPAEARRAVRLVPQLPAPATSLIFPPRETIEGGAELWLALGGTVTPADESITLVELATDLPPVTFERITATLVAEGWRVDVLFRNHSAEEQTATFMSSTADADEIPTLDPARFVLAGLPYHITIPAGQVAGESFIVTQPFVAIALLGEQLDVVAAAYIVCDVAEPVRAAMVGDGMAMVRRYIAADPVIAPASRDEPGDLLIFTVNPLADYEPLPLIAFNEPGDGPVYTNVVLTDAVVNVAHPVMANVDLSAVAVRELQTFEGLSGGFEVVASYEGQPIIATLSLAGRGSMVLTSFDIDPANTNWTLDESFVIFMANSVRWLVPRNHAQVGYTAPLDATDWQEWTALAPLMLLASTGESPWPHEGFWRDQWGRVRAVSLVGLNASEPTEAPMDIIEQWAPPAPATQPEIFGLGPILVLLAAGLWLAGWALR